MMSWELFNHCRDVLAAVAATALLLKQTKNALTWWSHKRATEAAMVRYAARCVRIAEAADRAHQKRVAREAIA